MFTKIKNNIWLLLICIFIITISAIGMVMVSLHLMSQPSTVTFVLGLTILLLTIFSSSYYSVIILECAINYFKNKLNKN
jgi:hypothetical protein